MAFETALLVRLQERIAAEQTRDISTLASGTLKDHSEYRYACGHYKGLNDVLTMITDIADELQKE